MKKPHLAAIVLLLLSPVIYFYSCAKDPNVPFRKVDLNVEFIKPGIYYCSTPYFAPSSTEEFIQEQLITEVSAENIKAMESKSIPLVRVAVYVPAEGGGWTSSHNTQVLTIKNDHLQVEVPESGDFQLHFEYLSSCRFCEYQVKQEGEVKKHEWWDNKSNSPVYHGNEVMSTKSINVALSYQSIPGSGRKNYSCPPDKK